MITKEYLFRYNKIYDFMFFYISAPVILARYKSVCIHIIEKEMRSSNKWEFRCWIYTVRGCVYYPHLTSYTSLSPCLSIIYNRDFTLRLSALHKGRKAQWNQTIVKVLGAFYCIRRVESMEQVYIFLTLTRLV